MQACGVVVEAHTIDERSEWRTFGDKVGALPGRRVGRGSPTLEVPRGPLCGSHS